MSEKDRERERLLSPQVEGIVQPGGSDIADEEKQFKNVLRNITIEER